MGGQGQRHVLEEETIAYHADIDKFIRTEKGKYLKENVITQTKNGSHVVVRNGKVEGVHDGEGGRQAAWVGERGRTTLCTYVRIYKRLTIAFPFCFTGASKL